MNIEKRISIMENGSGSCHLMGDGIIGYLYVDHEVYPELRRELNRMLKEIYEWAEEYGQQEQFHNVCSDQKGLLEYESEEWNRVLADETVQGETC